MDQHSDAASPWPVQNTLMRLSNPWLTLIGERLLTPEHQAIDYWRVEKVDSVIILPVWRDQVLIPPAVYRPGLSEVTLDLPGGRVPAESSPQAAAQQILQRELGVATAAIASLTPLNTTGWAINSSFSNQRLFGFRADLDATLTLDLPDGSQYFPCDSIGLQNLLQQLTCLQCRAVVLETLMHLLAA